MKNFNLRLSGIVVTFLLLAFGDTAWAGKIDFKRLNPIMDTLAKEAIAGDDTLVKVTPKFDEKYSNIETEQLRYSLLGEVTKAPWDKAATFDVQTTLETERSASKMGIWSKTKITALTDIIAMAKHGAEMAKQSGTSRNQFAGQEEEARKMFEALGKASSVKDIYQQIEKSRILGEAVLLQSIRDKRAVIRKELAAPKKKKAKISKPKENEEENNEEVEEEGDSLLDPEYAEFLEKEIEDLVNTLEVYRRQPQVEFDETRNVIRFSSTDCRELFITISAKSFFPEEMSIEISEKGIEVSIDFFVRTDKEDLDELKVNLEKAFVGALANNKEEKDNIRSAHKSALRAFKRALRTQAQNQQFDPPSRDDEEDQDGK